MPRFRKTRIAVLFGLLAGLAVSAGTPPAHATHITLSPGDSGIATLGEPVVIFGVVERGDVPAGGDFTHTYNFGFDMSGPGGVSVTPNFLEIGADIVAGFDMFEGTVFGFEGTVFGPGIPDEGLALIRDAAAQVPRINRIAADFAAVDTGGDTPYRLVINGSLLTGVEVGNYTGNIAVTPLPGAALLFLSALGGLVVVRRYRQQDAAAA